MSVWVAGSGLGATTRYCFTVGASDLELAGSSLGLEGEKTQMRTCTVM